LYRYFPNKDALFHSILSKQLGDIQRMVAFFKSYQPKDGLTESPEEEEKQNFPTLNMDVMAFS